MPFRPRREAPDKILALLDEAASLPSGWNEEDFDRALRRISQLYHEFASPRDDLTMDLKDVEVHMEEFGSTPDPLVHIKNTHPRFAFDSRVGAFGPLKIRTGRCSHGSYPLCVAFCDDLWRHGEI
jgi:hypothetical protein